MRLSDFAPRVNGVPVNPWPGLPVRQHGVRGLGDSCAAYLPASYVTTAYDPTTAAANLIAGGWIQQSDGSWVNPYKGWYDWEAIWGGSGYTNPCPAPPGVTEPAPNVLNSSAPSGGTSVTPTASLNKGQYTVGDTFQLILTGTPGYPVTVTASQNGVTRPNAQMGSIDSTGKLIITGTMTVDTVGQWVENWYVGGTPAGTLTFTVVPSALNPPSSSTSPVTSTQVQNTQTQGGSTALTNGTSSTNTSASTQPGSFDWLTKPISDSIPIPTWAVIAGGVAALFLMKD